MFQVGRRYLDHLIEDAQFDNAGNLCIRLFKNNAKLWQEEIIRFVHFQTALKQTRALTAYPKMDIALAECSTEVEKKPVYLVS